MTTMVEDASRSASPASEQPPPASTHHRIVGLGGQQEAKVVVVVAAENSSTRGLQRHRSYHSQSKTHRRLDKFQESPRHRRAISVRVKPTYIEEDEVNLPKPPVSIQVASPEDEDDLEVANTLGHRLDTPDGGGPPGGRRRSLPRIPVYNPDQSPVVQATGNYDPSEEQSEVFSNNSEFSPISPWQVNSSGQFNRQQEHSHFNFEQAAQPPPVIMDQFDEFLYKSKHIGSSNGMLNSQQYVAPEVQIEVPSDSDSSRRPSKYTISNTSSMYDMQRRRSCMSNYNEQCEQDQQPVSNVRPSTPSSADLLGARPTLNLDRRSSHTGVMTQRNRDQRPSSMKVISPRSSGQQMLAVPQARARGSSLPGNISIHQDDIYRLRNFSLAGKKIINRGDSLKTRSNHSIASGSNSSVNIENSGISSSRTNSEDVSPICSASSSRRASRGSRRASSACRGGAMAETLLEEPVTPIQYTVAMLGASGVGKSALTSQFLSSDHMNTYDTVEDDVQKIVSVSIDGKESQLIFIDHAYSDMSVENQVGTYCPNGYMIVFAVDDEDSLDEAEKTLSYLKKEEILQHQAVILVANKTDLVRSRLISTSNGKSLAMKYGVKYIETSPGINHNVDELLVGMLTQIRLREHENERNGSSTSSAKTKGFKVLGLFEKMWNGKDSKSKSCNNLHVL